MQPLFALLANLYFICVLSMKTATAVYIDIDNKHSVHTLLTVSEHRYADANAVPFAVFWSAPKICRVVGPA